MLRDVTIPEHLANRDLDSTILDPRSEPPSRARVVIVGGGIIGSSIAYHLTALGWTDVVVLERARLTAGTTWHAAGLVSRIRGTPALTALSLPNAPMYARLGEETGIETGFRQVGSLAVARTAARLDEYRYAADMSTAHGIETRMLAPLEVRDHWPQAEVDDLAGALLSPADGTVNPGHAALALAKGAKDRGATFVFGTTVTGFLERDGRLTGVRTDQGDVEAEAVVLAAGLWSSELARLAGLSVALYPAEHVWVMTEGDEASDERAPFLRDLDGSLYIRHYRDGYVVGAFEPRGKPKAPPTITTEGFAEFGEDWDHFAPVLGHARERLPVLREIGFRHYLRAPESFTPDANPYVGAFLEKPGLWIAAGLNSQGVIFAPGVGIALAEWIVEGHPTYDLTEVDPSRSGRWTNNRTWLHEKTKETLGRLYAMHWPGLQSEVARDVRRIPLTERLRAAGAAFGEAGGWERAAWFEPGASADPEWRYDFDRPSWWGPVAEEVRSCREAAALFDLSTYAKFLVQGRGAVEGLQGSVTADVDVEPGRVIYTVIANDRGGIEMDPTVTRLEDDAFLVLAPTSYQRRTEALLRRRVGPGTTVTDVTSGYAVLHVAGPASREVLSVVVDADLADDAFPFLSARQVEVGYAPAWALRVSFTGELGWELYVPTEFVTDVYDRIVAAGASVGLRHAGAFAFEALRLERGFRSWGHDVGATDDPFASGLGFAVSRAKTAPYVGRDALAVLRDAPRDRRLVSVLLDDPDAMLWHGEPVMAGETCIGDVTSGAYSSTLGAPVGLAWVHGEVPERADVLVRTRRIGARLSAAPFYDPKGERARG
jgi:4-methylaminobutanoate oxidase (formaldehyde-forming)